MTIVDNLEEIFQSWRNSNPNIKSLITLTTATGALFLALYSIKFLSSLYKGFQLYVLNQFCCSANLRKKYGQWAVISGSTDGIGLSFAKELAERGHSIVVIGRNAEKLANTKTLLEGIANVGDVLTVQIDLSDSSVENFEKIKDQIDPNNRDIGILINNAGMSSSRIRRFNHNDLDELRIMTNLNVLCPLYLTRIIMPGMLERQKGLILNVSSLLGAMDAPYMSVYGPTKTFLSAFSRLLQIEYSSHPIDIVDLTPGAVHTKLFTNVSVITKPGFVNPSPEYYVKSALKAVSTPMRSISGTIVHGLGKNTISFTNSLGLTTKLFATSMTMNAKDAKLSPVMKRKTKRSPSEVQEQQS